MVIRYIYRLYLAYYNRLKRYARLTIGSKTPFDTETGLKQNDELKPNNNEKRIKEETKNWAWRIYSVAEQDTLWKRG